MILGEVKARPKDIISFSLDYISKSKVQTSNPSSSPISLDTPARPADFSVENAAELYISLLLGWGLSESILKSQVLQGGSLTIHMPPKKSKRKRHHC